MPPLCLPSRCRYNISNIKFSYLKEDQNESFRFDETNCNNEFNFVCSCLSCDGIRICSQLRRNDIQGNYTADFKLYYNKRCVSVMENIPLLARAAPFKHRLQSLLFSFSAFWVRGKENTRRRSWTKWLRQINLDIIHRCSITKASIQLQLVPTNRSHHSIRFAP